MRLGFRKPAEVRLTIEPKAEDARSPDGYLNSIELLVDGSTALSLEIAMKWSDIRGAGRYQLGIFGLPDRHVKARAGIRFVQQDGRPLERFFPGFELGPDVPSTTLSGALDMRDLIAVDTGGDPTLLLIFETADALRLRLDCLIAYFA